jgi:hypothetical protein
MIEQQTDTRKLSVDEAAGQLGVEPAAVRMFVRQRFLRLASTEPVGVWEADVLRLHRVMLRQAAVAAPTLGAVAYR